MPWTSCRSRVYVMSTAVDVGHVTTTIRCNDKYAGGGPAHPRSCAYDNHEALLVWSSGVVVVVLCYQLKYQVRRSSG